MSKICEKHPQCSLSYRSGGRVKLSGIYRLFLGRRQGQDIWIVDGQRVSLELYPEFIMGGNDQRYRFNPPGEVWLDNRIGVEELKPTIAHELIERRLMRERGWTYDRAHDEGGLAAEARLRASDAAAARRANKRYAGEAKVYRAPFGKRSGANVWLIDGPLVRKELHPDFCFGTHDRRQPQYVTEGEIWLDSAMGIEESFYSLLQQSTERRLMLSGMPKARAYDCALVTVLNERMRQSALCAEHEAALPLVSYGVRERGVKQKRK